MCLLGLRYEIYIHGTYRAHDCGQDVTSLQELVKHGFLVFFVCCFLLDKLGRLLYFRCDGGSHIDDDVLLADVLVAWVLVDVLILVLQVLLDDSPSKYLHL